MFFSALRPGRSASTRASGSPDLMPSTRTFRALSCLQVYLPCCKAVGQADKMCCTVGWWCLQRGHLESILIFRLLRLSGVGRVTDPALTRKESCPAGRPAWMRPHTLFWASSSVMARNLFCMMNWFSLLF